MFKGDPGRGLPSFLLRFAAGFAVLVGILAGLEAAGVGARTLAMVIVAASLIAYAAFGVMSHTNGLDEWFVAGRRVPPLFNGMAQGAGWISGPVFIALAGGLSLGGYGWLPFLVGWTGGFVLMAVLLAPYLRKSGCYTVPEFIGLRYGGGHARAIAVPIVLVVCFALMAAQLSVMGLIAERMLGLPYLAGVWVGLLGILFCTVPGGMRSANWGSVAQYLVLIVAVLATVTWMSLAQGHGILPQFGGGAFARLAEIAPPPEAPPFPGFQPLAGAAGPADPMESWRAMALALCLMAGAAVMPHLLASLFAARSVAGARQTVAWALFFVLLVAVSAPALATLARLQLLDPDLPGAIVGQPVGQAAALDWVARWTGLGALRIEDLNADGILQAGEIGFAGGVLTLAVPDIAGLPGVISALIAAGAVAAAMSTGQVLLLAIASAIGHDLRHGLMEHDAPARQRLYTARALLVAAGVVAGWLAMKRVTDPLDTLAWACSFAASGLFFPLVLGIWWKRATRQGAIAGMVFGFAAAAVYLYMVTGGGMEPWIGIDRLRFGIVGMPVSLAATVLVSLLTPAPDDATRLLVDDLRRPSGAPVLVSGAGFSRVPPGG